MNEEEKKAIEFVKKRTKELKKYAKRENELVYDDIILNLIEKLQKENDELRKIKEISSNITEEDIDRIIKEAEKKYIPVQKIEDEIKELNKEEKEELKGLKGQERYFIRQIYQYEKIALQKLLKRED